MNLEEKHARAKEIDDKTMQMTRSEQKRFASLLSDVIERGLAHYKLSPEDYATLKEQLEGMRLGIELDY